MDGGQNKGPPQTSPGAKSVPRLWCAMDKPQCTHTREARIILSNKGTLWANVLEVFSQVPAHSRPLVTERLRRCAPNSAHY